jgi:hypothetical protein
MQLLYIPFTKVEQTPDGLIVEGVATSERPDADNEIVDYDSVKAQLPDYAQWGNIREMHGKSAAGVAVEITPDDESRTVFLRALVVDEGAQKKVRTQTYKGFSLGGTATSKMMKRDDGSSYVRRHVGLLSEISLVDRPANPDARFTLAKRAGGDMADELEETIPTPSTLNAVQLSASQGPGMMGGTDVTLTARVSATVAGYWAPGGSVDFYAGSQYLGTGYLDWNGTASWAWYGVPTGTCTVTAFFGGDGMLFDSSTSSTLYLTLT